MTEWGDRTVLARLALTRAMRRAARNAMRVLSTATGWFSKSPTRLLMVPQDLRTADPTSAADIYSGHFVFAGQAMSTNGETPFDLVPPSKAWAEQLYGFAWLRHLRAADTAIARANGRTLTDDFMRGRHWQDENATGTLVTSRRLISLLTHASMIAEGADLGFYERFVAHLARTARSLSVDMNLGLTQRDRLAAAIGCLFAAMCLDRQERLFKQAARALAAELDWQILPDGGHVSRNPRLLIEILLDLLPLRGLYAGKGLEPPRALTGAIDRIMPQIRMFRHGDGTLALFNGMGVTAPDTLATLLAYDDARAQPMSEAPYSGYERLEAKGALLIADVGCVLDVWASAEACAAPLAFEFSSGRQRLVVNCGFPRVSSPSLEKAARSTAAHSTLVIDDHSAGHFVGIGGETLLLGGAQDVPFKRMAEASGLKLDASHDGYSPRFGAVHRRSWTLARDGHELAGEDALSFAQPPSAPLPCVLRFHLHPSLHASLVHDGRDVMLVTPAQEQWLFHCAQGTVSIEDSVFLAAADGNRRSDQIVVSFDAASLASLHWRFTRIEAPQKRAGAVARQAEAPETHLL